MSICEILIGLYMMEMLKYNSYYNKNVNVYKKEKHIKITPTIHYDSGSRRYCAK